MRKNTPNALGGDAGSASWRYSQGARKRGSHIIVAANEGSFAGFFLPTHQNVEKANLHTICTGSFAV